MNDFYRMQEHDLSLSSIAGLRTLLDALTVADIRLRGQRFQQEVDSKLEDNWLEQPKFRCHESMAISPEHQDAAEHLRASIHEALRSLAAQLDVTWTHCRTGEHSQYDGQFENRKWTFGTLVYRVERRQILRGDVEIRRAIPLVEAIPDTLVQYLITVPGLREQLAKERHGHWGYHYHYLDARDRRSDTLLTFDQKSATPLNPTLRWEKHAERRGFEARAANWGDSKRESIYSVCKPDVLRFPLSEFKRPASHSKIVWPHP